MADKQYYVKVNFEFGVDNEDGTFTVKNPGSLEWLSMSYQNAVAFQNYAVIPALKEMITKAGESGMVQAGLGLPDDGKTDKVSPGQNR